MFDQAKYTQGHKVTGVLDQLTNYLISDDGEQLLNELYVHIVEGADSLVNDALGKLKRDKRGREKNRDKKKNAPYLLFLLYLLFLITTLVPNPVSDISESSRADTGASINGALIRACNPLTLFLLFLLFVIFPLISS